MVFGGWYNDIVVPLFIPLGITPFDYLTAIGVMCGLLFGAADYRIGLMAVLMILISNLAYFTFYGIDVTRVIVLILSTIVIMSITVFLENSGRGMG